MDASARLRMKAIPWFTGLGITSRTGTWDVPGRQTGQPMLRAFTHSGARASRLFFGLRPRPTLAEMERICRRYLVFKVETEQ